MPDCAKAASDQPHSQKDSSGSKHAPAQPLQRAIGNTQYLRALYHLIVNLGEPPVFCTTSSTIAEIVRRNNSRLPGERQLREQSEQITCNEQETQNDNEYADLPDLAPMSDSSDEEQECDSSDDYEECEIVD